jgi:phosphate:Na+ symporter
MKDIESSLKQMAKSALEMADAIYQGLMENEINYLNSALTKERIIDNLEREITARVFAAAKDLDEATRRKNVLFAQMAENLERMGDEMRSLTERVEIKIAEGLLFSEIGIEQYKEVFATMYKSLELINEFLNENKLEVLDTILKNGEQIKQLIEKYRKEHLERLAKGICEPMAANMYFDMLDFSGNVARHCTNIARILKEQ